MHRPTVETCKRYGSAAVAALCAMTICLLLEPILHDKAVLLLFALAILSTAAYGGLGPGLLCTAVSTIAALYIWIDPMWSLRGVGPAGWVELSLLIVVGVGISLISAALRAAQRATVAAVRDRDTSRRVADILSSITDCFFAVDRQWLVTDINAKTASFVSEGPEALRGRLLWDIVPQLKASVLGQQMCRSMDDGSVADMELPSVVIPGHWIEVHVRPSPAGLSIYFRDITARKQAEEALRFSQERLRAALMASATGTFRWHIQTNGLEWDENLDRLFGLPPGQTVHHLEGFLQLVHPEDRAAVTAQVQQCARDVMDFDMEFRVVWPDGSVHWLADKGRTIADESGRPLYMTGACTDVTARKADEKEVQRAKAAAERASAAKDQFLAVLSHELRTPLTPVLAVAGLLGKDGRLPEDARADAQMICRNVELETRLIDDLLDVTRISRGKLRLEQKTVDICVVLRQALEICSSEADAKGLRLSLDIQEGCHRVHGDSSRLQQVFWNLLKNAIKFTPPQGSIVVRCLAGYQGSVIVQVTDTGIGIEPQFLTRIFDAFDQGDRTVTREFGGLGLGLAISKALVEMHGGAISASSGGKGMGATFRVELPSERVPDTIVPSVGRPTTPPLRVEEPKPLEILLVEDHADTARIMGRLLRGEGHTIHVAGSVAAALDLVHRAPIDLLISDLGLPDGSGVDLMRALRAQGSPLKGIALSGFGRPEDMDRSREAGFAEHLTKPVNFDQLRAAIERVIGTDCGVAKAPVA